MLDRGCGLKSRSTLATALRQLEERSLIRSVKTQTTVGDQATTCYALWFVGDDAPGSPARLSTGAVEEGSARIVPGGCVDRTTGGTRRVLPVVRGSYPQQTVETTNTTQHTVSSKREAPSLESSDSTGPTEGSTSVGTEVSPSPLAAVVARLSTEFGDDAPRASQTRVTNLRRAAGVDETDLLSLLDEAATITRSQAGVITKRGREGTIVRMPYLLATLRDLIAAAGRTAAGSGAPFAPGPGGSALPVSCLTTTSPVPGPTDPQLDDVAVAVWDAVLSDVREVLTRENFAQWFAPLCVLALEGNTLHVAAPSPFHAQWLTHKLHPHVRRALERMGQSDVRVTYDVMPTENVPLASLPADASLSCVTAASPVRALEVVAPPLERGGHLHA